MQLKKFLPKFNYIVYFYCTVVYDKIHNFVDMFRFMKPSWMFQVGRKSRKPENFLEN